MSEEKKDVKGTTEVAEVKNDVIYVSTKDAFRSIGHNMKEKLTDKEAWKARGKKALKGLAIAGVVVGGFAMVDKLTKPDAEPEGDEDWQDDIIDDAEYSVVDATADGSETNELTTEE
jgi:hypothetical protein